MGGAELGSMAIRSPKKRPSGPDRGVLLVAARKGAWIFHGDEARRKWRLDGPPFLGHTIHHPVLDLRDDRTLMAAAKTGHLDPTVFRSRGESVRIVQALSGG